MLNSYYRYLKDTPRWLIKKGRGKKAAKAAVYIKRWDEKVSPEKAKHITYIIEKSAQEEVSFFILSTVFVYYKSSLDVGSVKWKRN